MYPSNNQIMLAPSTLISNVGVKPNRSFNCQVQLLNLMDMLQCPNKVLIMLVANDVVHAELLLSPLLLDTS